MKATKQEYTVTVTEGADLSTQEEAQRVETPARSGRLSPAVTANACGEEVTWLPQATVQYTVTVESKPTRADMHKPIDDDDKMVWWINAFNIFVISIVAMFMPEVEWYMYPAVVLISVILSIFLMPFIIPEYIALKIVIWLVKLLHKLFTRTSSAQPSVS